MNIEEVIKGLVERVEWLEAGLKEKDAEIEELSDRVYRLDRDDS